jgi:hypothetical protein
MPTINSVELNFLARYESARVGLSSANPNFLFADNSKMERNGYRRLRLHQRPRTFHQAKPKIVQITILAIDAIRPSFHQVCIRT